MAKRESRSNRGSTRTAYEGDTDDITTLTARQAKALVKEYSNRTLSLKRLARLSDETAKALAKHNDFAFS
jgi:hypothetical protein